MEKKHSYRGRWWEFQANQAIGSLLLPGPLLNAFLEQSESPIPGPAERESLAKKAAAIFDVNPIVVRIRLDALFP